MSIIVNDVVMVNKKAIGLVIDDEIYSMLKEWSESPKELGKSVIFTADGDWNNIFYLVHGTEDGLYYIGGDENCTPEEVIEMLTDNSRIIPPTLKDKIIINVLSCYGSLQKETTIGNITLKNCLPCDGKLFIRLFENSSNTAKAVVFSIDPNELKLNENDEFEIEEAKY